MQSTHILYRLIKAKEAEIERYQQLLKYQTSESEERLDVIDRMKYRMNNAREELTELQAVLELVEKYSDEH